MNDDKLKRAVPEGFEQVVLQPVEYSPLMYIDIALSEGMPKGEGFDLWYTSFGLNKMSAISSIRSMTGMGLKELNVKAHYPPILLKEKLSITELNEFILRHKMDHIIYSFKE
ncbi:ribosomal protein L7/L12 [Marinomonas spartinae]|uniref:ribosomal protein L7/L12 n=1 Tax=Marinomonas spartinae TaxID=1792290 RepID=UPI0018F1D34D|nr:ribosomal protein L7/L12 [Marinomonas spartinae]MBJ7556931.1 ribosomal protein L7/L12 [Marinomonas spartinae]